MFITQPLTLAPLLGLAATLAWTVARPGPLPAVAAIVAAGWLVWALHRQAQAQAAGLARRLAEAEDGARGQRDAAAQSELARARAETELRAIDERYQLALRGCQ